MKLNEIYIRAAELVCKSYEFEYDRSYHMGCCLAVKHLKDKGEITIDECSNALTLFKDLYKPDADFDTFWFGRVTNDESFEIRILALLFAAQFYDRKFS